MPSQLSLFRHLEHTVATKCWMKFECYKGGFTRTLVKTEDMTVLLESLRRIVR